MPRRLPALDNAGLEHVRESFLAQVSEFGDFGDAPSAYHTLERAWRDEASALARKHLPPALFADVSDEARQGERIVAAVLRVLTAPLRTTGLPQDVLGWRYTDFLRRMDAGERTLFAREMGPLLYGPGEAPERVEAFVSAMWPVWRRTQGERPYALTRIFPTALLMLLHPRTGMAARTDLLARAAPILLPGATLLRYHPFGAGDYRRVLEFAGAVRAALQRWGWSPRDMMDVHAFLSIGTRAAEPKSLAANDR
jgi:hypothetical protein